MLWVYINYPNPHLTIHYDPGCGRIRAMRKPEQRVCRIGAETISSELQKFKTGQYRFGSTPATNDMWIAIDFQDEAFEKATATYIHRLLSQRHKPFVNAPLEEHCPRGRDRG